MTPEELLFPSERSSSQDLLFSLLNEFQEQFDTRTDRAEALVEEHRRVMRELCPIVASDDQSDVAQQSRIEWMRRSVERHLAEEWIEEHKEAVVALDVDVAHINVHDPRVAPLWKRFADRKRAFYQSHLQAMRDFQDANETCFDTQIEQASLDDEPSEDDEWDEPDAASSTDFCGSNANDDERDEVDLRFASASPEDLDAHSSSQEEEEAEPAGVAQSFVPLPHEVALFDAVKKRVLDEFKIEGDGAAPLEVSSLHWQQLEAEALGRWTPSDDENERLGAARVQKALIEAFTWARRWKVEDEERLVSEIRDGIAPFARSSIHDWNRRSNGASGIIHAELLYEGAQELAGDGFSIQSESRILHPFDKD